MGRPSINTTSVLPPKPRKSEAAIAAEIAEYEAAQKRNKAAMLLEICGVPDEHRAAVDLRTDTLPADARVGWANASRMAASILGKQAIVALLGPRGTGKSTIGGSLVLSECHAGRSARYVLAHAYLRACVEGRAFSAKVTESEVERRHVQQGLLVIDELHLVAASDREWLAMVALIQARWDARRPTILIANETKQAFADRVGQSIADRMRQHGGTLVCDWPSLRGRIARP